MEGWSESLSFELSEFGVGLKTIEPELMATEIGNRSVIAAHPACDPRLTKFLAAIAHVEDTTLDLHSRYVLHWQLSNTLEADWCVEILQQSLQQCGKPQIFTTDQGSQFTSDNFIAVL